MFQNWKATKRSVLNKPACIFKSNRKSANFELKTWARHGMYGISLWPNNTMIATCVTIQYQFINLVKIQKMTVVVSSNKLKIFQFIHILCLVYSHKYFLWVIPNIYLTTLVNAKAINYSHTFLVEMSLDPFNYSYSVLIWKKIFYLVDTNSIWI